ncbi:DMT family transporter [Allorhizocola rhizosphaerae]|uniref:DMT family transporter n=1 Tax=Allorhizocola rhizosphaerae TaxID=1872709 RepID=UPI001FE4844C|nr:DMT family transporter [Allorhizocola rhizosphaerae]
MWTIAALAIGVLSVSTSGPLIAYATAPALAIAFWRNALAAGVLAPITLSVRRGELALARTHIKICLIAGLALAAHFGTWVPSVKLTSVATATALVCIQPVWAGLITVWQGGRLGRLTWIGIIAAVAGAAIATGPDIRAGGPALAGDLLAVVGGIAGAIYNIVGERARAVLTTTTYTTVCYGACAAVLLTTCLALNTPIAGFGATAWLIIIGLTVGPQLLGHSMFNYALQKVPATAVSVIVLLEVPGAGLLGWVWLGQTLSVPTLFGLVLVIVGVAVVVATPAARIDRRRLPASDL